MRSKISCVVIFLFFISSRCYAQTDESTTNDPTTDNVDESPTINMLTLRSENNQKIVATVPDEEGDFFVRNKETGEEAGLFYTAEMAMNNMNDLTTLKEYNLNTRVGTIESFNLNARLTVLEDHDLDTRVSGLERDLPNEVERLETDITTNENNIADVADDLADLQQETSNTKTEHGKSISDLETKTSNHDTKLDQHGQDIIDLENRMDQAEDDISGLETDVDDLETDTTLLKTLTQADSLLGMAKSRPAPTCAHLAAMPGAKDLYSNGKYWIDPDLGSTDNAFEADCDMDTGTTKVKMTSGAAYRNYHTGDDTHGWYSDFTGYTPVTYAADKSQLAALAASSSFASQTLVFRCRGVISWHYPTVYQATHALRFKSMINSNFEWGGKDTDVFIPNVPLATDGCKSNGNSDSSTIFRFETSQADMLPIFDVRVHDHGSSNEIWGFSGADVIYSTSLLTGATKLTAGQSCSHILQQYPDSKDGYYWIDPNGGSLDDAVEVECRMSTGGWTVVPPPNDIPHSQHFTDGDSRRWMTSKSGFPSFDVDFPKSQLEALQRFSSQATTTIVVSCNGVVVWHEDSIGTPDIVSSAAFFFKSSEGIIWGPEQSAEELDNLDSRANPVPVVLNDGCRKNDNNAYGEADFVFNTNDAFSLPIADVMGRDVGNQGERFGFQFQPTLFRTSFKTKLGMSSLYPGKTCFDIYTHHPDAPDGYYWIDPDGDQATNSVLAKCDMKNGGWTGVVPKPVVPYKNWYTGSDGFRVWSSSGHGYIPYDLPEDQIIALHKQADKAYQQFKVQCRGVITWHSSSGSIAYDAFQFWGGSAASKVHWHASATQYSRPKVDFVLDGCRYNSDAYISSAPIEFETGYPQGLPIIDFRVYDVGGSTEQFGIQMGIAWFK